MTQNKQHPNAIGTLYQDGSFTPNPCLREKIGTLGQGGSFTPNPNYGGTPTDQERDMTMYTIRPLEWDDTGTGKAFTAYVISGAYVIREMRGWWRWKDSNSDGKRGCGLETTLEAAKAAAEAHYRGRMEQGLEVVG